MKILFSLFIYFIITSMINSFVIIEQSGEMNEMNDKFNKLGVKYVDTYINYIREYEKYMKASQDHRDENIKIYQNQIDEIKSKMITDSAALDNEKTELKEKIQEIRDSIHIQTLPLTDQLKMAENDYNLRMEKLKERKHQLESLITEYCENCDDVINELQLEAEVAQVNQQIAQIDSEFQEKSQSIEEALMRLKSEGIENLYHQYAELISVYEAKLDEADQSDILNELNDKIIDEWNQYAVKFEAIHAYLEYNLNETISNAFEVDQLIEINEIVYNSDDVLKNFQVFIKKFNFFDYENSPSSPCTEFIINIEGNLYGNNCYESDFEETKIVNFNGVKYQCTFEKENILAEYVYNFCDQFEEATTAGIFDIANVEGKSFYLNLMKLENSETPCTNFEYNDDLNIFGVNCYESIILTPRIVNYMDQYYSCSSVISDNIFAVYYNCQNSEDYQPEEYENNVKVYVPRKVELADDDYDDEASSSCDTFKLNAENNLIGDNCYEKYVNSPKEITYDDKSYKCFSVIADELFSVFSQCKRVDAVDRYSDDSQIGWMEFHEKSSSLPRLAVRAGYDIDGSALYVIRKQYSDSILYGKYASGFERKNGYVTNSANETGVNNFEVLMAEKYSWCKFNPFESYEVSLPICRVRYAAYESKALIPGTLLYNGNCRIGFNWEIHEISKSEVDTLVFGSC